jgi:hypothetical protein
MAERTSPTSTRTRPRRTRPRNPSTKRRPPAEAPQTAEQVTEIAQRAALRLYEAYQHRGVVIRPYEPHALGLWYRSIRGHKLKTALRKWYRLYTRITNEHLDSRFPLVLMRAAREMRELMPLSRSFSKPPWLGNESSSPTPSLGLLVGEIRRLLTAYPGSVRVDDCAPPGLGDDTPRGCRSPGLRGRLTFRTDKVVLKDDEDKDKPYDMGRFDVFLYFDYLACYWKPLDSTIYRIAGLEPNYPGGGDDPDGVIHPHVNHGGLCAGDGAMAIATALSEGRVGDAYDVVNSVLHTYSSDSPFLALRDWDGPGEVTCSECGDVIDADDARNCQHRRCGVTLCEDHANLCAVCGEVFCGEHRRYNDDVGESYCLQCCKKCPCCHEFCDKNAIDKRGVCDTCYDDTYKACRGPCGKRHDPDELRDGVCPDCRAAGLYVKCKRRDCDNWHKPEDMISGYCRGCRPSEDDEPAKPRSRDELGDEIADASRRLPTTSTTPQERHRVKPDGLDDDV